MNDESQQQNEAPAPVERVDCTVHVTGVEATFSEMFAMFAAAKAQEATQRARDDTHDDPVPT